MVSEPLIVRCPITDQNVQVRLDNEEAQANQFEGMTCPSCTQLHFVNRKTGKLLGGPE